MAKQEGTKNSEFFDEKENSKDKKQLTKKEFKNLGKFLS